MSITKQWGSPTQARAKANSTISSTVRAGGLSLILGLAACIIAAVLAAPALAGTTGASTFTKTGTDPADGSAATATSSIGKTAAGDTLNWVLHYTNSTGAPAKVKITDPIGANQTFVKGSLVVPAGTGLSPEWSTDGGVGYVASEPGSGVNAVAASGLVAPTGLGGTSTFTPISTPTAGNGESGDGFEDIFYGGNVYNLHHHFYPGETNGAGGKYLTLLACHVVATGQECPNYSGGLYANSEAGRPFSSTLSEDNFTTMSSNWTAMNQSTGKLYFATTIFGTGKYGIGCLDLATNASCGFTQLGVGPEAATGVYQGWIVGGATVGSHYYLLDHTGQLVCFNISTGSTCGTSTAYPGASFNFGEMSSAQAVNWAGSNYVFTSASTSGTSFAEELSCVNVSTGQRCPGYPLSIPAPAGPVLVPVLNSSGATVGVCDEWFSTPGVTSTRQFACYDTSGKPIATPAPYSTLPAGTATDPWPVYAGSTVVVGTKEYYDAATGKTAYPENMSYQYQCFDWATNAPCAGFSSPVESAEWGSFVNSGTHVDLQTYTLVQDPYLPGCLAEDGNAGVVQYFDAATGALGCSGLSARVAVNPAASYCDGSAHATAWSQLVISGISASQYTGAIYTVYDKEGNPVPGFTEVSLAPGQDSVNISSIPMSGSTSELSVVMTIANPAAGAGAQLSLTFAGTSGAEVCFRTMVGQAKCSTAQAISNQGNAVTTGLNGVSDAPSGDSSGEAVFFLPASPTMSRCQADLSIEKRADGSVVKAGGQVMYTLVVRNHGPDTGTSVKVSDSVPSGLSIVSAHPTQGTCTVAGAIDCSLGSIVNGGAAQILVVADVASNASGKIVNSAEVHGFQTDPNPSNNTSSATIEATQPPLVPPQADVQVLKRVNHSSAKFGELLTYTLVVKNNGPVAAPDAMVTDTSAQPLHVRSVKPSQGTCGKGSPFRCSLGRLAAGATATITVKAMPRQTGAEVNSVSVAPGCTSGGECPVDSNPANNVSYAKTTVRPYLKLKKWVNHAVVRAPHRLVYHLLVSNPTPVAIKDVKVCDRLPLGIVFERSSHRAHLVHGEQCWSLGALQPHRYKAIKVVAKVLRGTKGKRVNHAYATAKGVKTAKAHAKVRVKPAQPRTTPVTG